MNEVIKRKRPYWGDWVVQYGLYNRALAAADKLQQHAVGGFTGHTRQLGGQFFLLHVVERQYGFVLTRVDNQVV